jgi:uncharacterized protein (TIGR02444 family)
MSANDNNVAAASQSPFWRFSIRFYAMPGVAPACIELQDRAGVDVNVLFFLLWNATQNRALSEQDVAAVERAIGPWRDGTVVPLRNVRRALKTPPPAMMAEAAESLRNRVKSVELEAERLQQEALYHFAQSGRLGHNASTPLEAARASLASYQTLLKSIPSAAPMPPAALEAVLSALASLKAPPADGV